MIPSARETQLTQQLATRDRQIRDAETELGQRRQQVDRLTTRLQSAEAALAAGLEATATTLQSEAYARAAWQSTIVQARRWKLRAELERKCGELSAAVARREESARAEQAEARIAAVRALVGDLRTWLSPEGITAISVADAIEAALDGATTSTTVATCGQACDGGHTYDGQCLVDPQFDSVIGQSTDPQHPGWYWSCEGDESGCEGWLSLDHASAAAARRSYDRHVARAHQTAEARP
jgi:hypothetical protein